MGLLPEKDCRQLLALGEEVRRRISNPIPAKVRREGNRYFLQFDEPQLVNHVVMKENLLTGKELNGFRIYIYGYPCVSDTLLEVYQGSTVGHKAICRFPTVRTAQVEVRFDEEDAELDDLSCYYVQ